MDDKILPVDFIEGKRLNPDDMLEDSLALASVGVAALKMLEKVLPSTASNVENATKVVVDHFRQLADCAKIQSRLIDILIAQKYASPGQGENDSVRTQADFCAGEVRKATEGLVVAMQFQDRNTQITENATRVLREYGGMLADIRDRIGLMRLSGEGVGASASAATETLMSHICIGDIRKHFMEALDDVNLQYKRGLPAQTVNASDEDNIELF